MERVGTYGLEDSMDVVIENLQSLPSPGAFDSGCFINTVCVAPDVLTMLFYEYGLQVVSHEDWTLSEIFVVTSKGTPIIADNSGVFTLTDEIHVRKDSYPLQDKLFV